MESKNKALGDTLVSGSDIVVMDDTCIGLDDYVLDFDVSDNEKLEEFWNSLTQDAKAEMILEAKIRESVVPLSRAQKRAYKRQILRELKTNIRPLQNSTVLS